MSSIDQRVADRVLAVRVARRHAAGETRLVQGLLEEAEKQLKKYKAWASSFPSVLAHAETMSKGLESGFVWQDDLVEYWAPFTSIQHELLGILDGLIELNQGLGDEIEPYIDPPAKAQIEFAIEDPKFFARPAFDRKQIAYPTARLKAWHRNFVRWVDGASRGVHEKLTRI